MLNIKRNILLNPGPATTTDTVKMAQVVSDICPRETEFVNVLAQIQNDLVKIVHGNPNEYTAVLFCGSGTICMDICLNSLLPENRKILIINNGAYSSRAVEICEYYNLPYIEMKIPINEIPKLSDIETILLNNRDIHLVYTTHNETGTGLLNPIREIGVLAHKYKCIFAVDTTSTYAMLPIDMKKDNIDFCMSSAQKGLMAMTGLSYVIGKIKLIENSKFYPKRSYYCNLYLQYEYFIQNRQMHFTPPVQIIYALRQAIEEFFQEGEIQKYARHKRVHKALQKGIEELGFKEFIKKEFQVGLIISVIYPDDNNWNFEKIHDYCYERGFTIYPGKVANINTFRLCSFGAIDVWDIENFFAVFKEALEHYNVKIPVKYINNKFIGESIKCRMKLH